jgi:hypothetical protein
VRELARQGLAWESSLDCDRDAVFLRAVVLMLHGAQLVSRMSELELPGHRHRHRRQSGARLCHAGNGYRDLSASSLRHSLPNTELHGRNAFDAPRPNALPLPRPSSKRSSAIIFARSAVSGVAWFVAGFYSEHLMTHGADVTRRLAGVLDGDWLKSDHCQKRSTECAAAVLRLWRDGGTFP